MQQRVVWKKSFGHLWGALFNNDCFLKYFKFLGSKMGADLSLYSTADRLDYNISQRLALLRQLDPESVQFKFLNLFSRSFEILGSSATTIPCTLIAAIYFRYFKKDPYTSIFLFNLMLAQLVNVIVTGIIKGVVRRRRPEYSLNDDMYLTHGPDVYSFPSGHALQMSLLVRFMLTYMVCGRLLILFSAVCCFITFLRIFTGRHYLSDVLGGCLIGWYSFDFYAKFVWQNSMWL
jgi:membrane-associated phospholipid phosphatase